MLDVKISWINNDNDSDDDDDDDDDDIDDGFTYQVVVIIQSVKVVIFDIISCSINYAPKSKLLFITIFSLYAIFSSDFLNTG